MMQREEVMAKEALSFGQKKRLRKKRRGDRNHLKNYYELVVDAGHAWAEKPHVHCTDAELEILMRKVKLKESPVNAKDSAFLTVSLQDQAALADRYLGIHVVVNQTSRTLYRSSFDLIGGEGESGEQERDLMAVNMARMHDYYNQLHQRMYFAASC